MPRTGGATIAPEARVNDRDRDLRAAVGDDAARALRRWRRRVRLGVVVGAAAEGLGAAALLAAAAVLVARTFGAAAEPSAWWAAGLAVPIAWAAWRLRAARPALDDAALHLDRRVGLEGLLLSALEGEAGAWREALSPRLRRVGSALPRVRTGRAALRAGVPLAVLACLLCLPPPAPETRGTDPALARALERFERRFEELSKHEGLREEARKDVEERVKALEARREKGDAVSWADVDALEEKTDREAKQRAAALARAKADAAAFARAQPGDLAEARAEAASLLAEAETAGLADDVPAGTASPAGVGADGKLDPQRGDAAALKALAQALEGTASERLDALSRLGAIDPSELAALERLMKDDPAAKRMTECPKCHGDDPGG